MFRSRPPAFVPLAAMVAALAVHQARYTLLPEHDAESHHGYLAYAPGLLGMVLAAALGLALARLLAGAEPPRCPGSSPPPSRPPHGAPRCRRAGSARRRCSSPFTACRSSPRAMS